MSQHRWLQDQSYSSYESDRIVLFFWDNSISFSNIDNMLIRHDKTIWIILELYFESYEFSNFRDFLWIFSEFIFDF